MKVAAAIIIALIAVGALVAAFLVGWGLGMRRNYADKLRELGLNKRTAVLHVRATRIIRDLARRAEFDGDNAPDQLSPETKADVCKWANDYRIGGSL